MKTSQLVIKNFLSLSGAEFISRILGSILGVYVARFLGANAFGQLTFATAYISFYDVFADFGLTFMGVREIAKNKEKSNLYGSHILMIHLLLSLGLFLIIAVSLNFLPISSAEKILVLLLGLNLIPNAVNLNFIFQAHEKMEFVAIVKTVSQISYVLFGFLLLFITRDIITVPIAQIATGITGAISAYLLLQKNNLFQWEKINKKEISRIFKKTLPFLISAVAIRTYYNLDSVLLKFMTNSTTVGYYNASYKIAIILTILARFFQSAIYPTLSKLLQNNHDQAKKLLEQTIRISIFLALPATVGGTLLAKPIILFIYGDEFIPSIEVFQILIWSVFTIYTNVSFGVTLMASGHEKKYTQAVVGGTIINVILNLILIPSLGMIGSAIATLITEFFVLLSFVFFAKKIVSVGFVEYLWQSIVGIIPMTLLLHCLQTNLFLEVGAGFLIYFFTMFVFKFIKINDIQNFKSIIRK